MVMSHANEGNIIGNYMSAFPFSITVFVVFYTIVFESLFFRKKA